MEGWRVGQQRKLEGDLERALVKALERGREEGGGGQKKRRELWEGEGKGGEGGKNGKGGERDRKRDRKGEK